MLDKFSRRLFFGRALPVIAASAAIVGITTLSPTEARASGSWSAARKFMHGPQPRHDTLNHIRSRNPSSPMNDVRYGWERWE